MEQEILFKKIQHCNKTMDERMLGALDNSYEISQSMLYSLTAGGKRLRPFLFIETARLLGLREEEIVDVALAIEFVHTYSLIHDDLPAMDNASYRRGKPSCHKKFDEATAILAGDALLTEAFALITNNAILNSDIKCRLVSGLVASIGYQGMVTGQLLDLQAENKELSLTQIEELQYFKTGKLFTYCCYAAGIIAGLDESHLNLLENYARNLGLLYQITDDIIDYEGDEKIAGKDLRRDAIAGKATFVAKLGLEECKLRAASIANDAITSISKLKGDKTTLIMLIEYIKNRKS